MKKNYLSSNGYYILLILSLQFFNAKAQLSYTFTTSGATGLSGPTQAQVNASYGTGNSLNGLVTVIGSGIQQFTVPSSGIWKIETRGAEGGSSIGGANTGTVGGLGAIMSGEFNLNSGDVLKIVVGQMGGSTGYSGGGGGGSYAVTSLGTPLCIAGGGGGAHGYVGDSRGCTVGAPGLTTTTAGNSDYPGGPTYGVSATGAGGGAPGLGGNSGYGGGSGVASGGGGLLSDGANGGTSTSIYNYGGKAFINGSMGGAGTNNVTYGGFGGGGSTQPASGYGGGGGGYSGGGGGSLINGATIAGSGGGGGSFNSGTNQNNIAGANSGAGMVIIKQLNTPINVAATSSAICIGSGPVTMTASGVTTYTWLPVGSFAGSNSAIITDNPTSTTVYTVQGTDALGLSVSQFTIYVGGGPINVNVPNPVICAGQSSTLVASGASTYNWSSQSGGFSTITTGTLVINTNSMSGGGYDVIGTDSFGCNSPVASLTITVLSPAAAISGPSITCKGNYYTLSASGADTYTWSTGSNSSSISVSPNVNTVYTLIGGQSQGNVNCYNTASLSVTAYNSPGVGAISNRNNICSGENVLLTAIGAINYTWTNGVTTHTGSTWQVNPISNQTTSSQGYTVTGSNQYNCSNTSTIAITVNPCTGIAENTGVSKLSIYPNPNKGEFVISAAQAMELQIINETGQVVKTIKIDKDKTEIKLNNLSSGVYFIVGKGEQGTVKEKIIVEK